MLKTTQISFFDPQNNAHQPIKEVVTLAAAHKEAAGHLFLVTEDLLTTLAASHAVLLLLPQLGRGELDLLLDLLDAVSHSIESVLLLALLLAQTWSSTLTLK